ncbi:sensor histidine kinase [Aureimonas glaciei]|uniref:histidine kinase n=1 Tax=Aureimonas glaciei TaxID=1776957 RepID=A0A916Y2U7_9HYPH|nr:histidine kinase dimerization/phosphoacceptor domain -containing protein [Aureimonas glaciei]GGD28038.1 sensor histidine kinase [Aureimonas glaciei]
MALTDVRSLSRPIHLALVRTAHLRRLPLFQWSVAVAAFVVAFGLRYGLNDQLPVGFPYLTFFPAVILTTFFAGLYPGIAVAVASGLASWYFFIPPFHTFSLVGGAPLALAFYIAIVSVDIFLLHWMHLSVDRLGREREKAEGYARQRDLLFQELQHRVSNNLAVVSSMLSAQSRALEGEAGQAALVQASARIGLISKIQRQLHDPSRQSLDLAPYLRQLGPDLMEASGADHIAYAVNAEPLDVPAALAVPLGLIATELISNAIEHGFAHSRAGTLSVTLRQRGDGEVVLTVADDGPGWPEGYEAGRSRNLGMRIVLSLTQQIGGSFAFRNEAGAVSELRFRLPDPA